MITNNTLAIYKKETKNYFFSLSSYLYAVIFIGISTYLYFQTFFVQGQVDTHNWFQSLPFLLLFFIPALSMGAISEEKKRGTWEILLTLPTNEAQVIIAKFLAGFTFVFFMFLLNIGLLITLAVLGSPDWGIIFTSYLGTLLLAGGYLSTGLFISSLVSQQTISFVSTFALLFLNDLFSQDFFLLKIPPSFKNFFLALSLRTHYENFVRGLITIPDLIFILSWIFVFLLLTVVSLKSRDF